MALDERKLNKARKMGYGLGLLKGMAVTLKHLFKHNVVIQYPDEKQDLPRTRGVIALKEENCTVCMLCARECPDWCIYIDSHKETLPPKREGGRPRKRNVLDRFAIDYALCMYCGICVEVCPYDALFWSREFEYAEYDIRELTHEKERLSDWMSTVLPPPELEVGAEVPGQTPAATNGAAVAAAPAPAAAPVAGAGAAGPDSAQRPSAPAAARAAEERPEQAEGQPAAVTAAPPEAKASDAQVQSGETKETQPEGRAQATEEKAPEGKAAEGEAEPQTTAPPETAAAPVLSAQEKASFQESPGPNVEVPQETRQPVALTPTEDAEAVYKQVLQEQIDKGSSPQVAEARAKVARVKAERGIRRGPTPIQTDKMVPSAPTKGQPEPAQPGGAPEATEPQPEQGPVAAEEEQEAPAPAAEAPAPAAEAPAPAGGDDPEAVFERVLAEERAKGSSDAVAQGRAKAARVKAERARKNG